MKFAYQLTDNKGKIQKGEIEASTVTEARKKLVLREGTVISLEEVSKKKKGGRDIIIFNRIKVLEKVMFAKHLAVMIKAGMALDAALEVLQEGASPAMVQRLKKILEEVRKGNTLSSALKQYAKDFGMLFVNMVAAGEQGGSLSNNLNLLAAQQQKDYELRNKLRAASVYPTLILIAIVGLIVVISIFVLPKITGFFATLKVDLPLSTKILMTVAGFFANQWLWVVVGIVVLVILLRVMLRIKVTRFILHNLILKGPMVGKISRNMNLALFCRTLASLLNSGITIDRSLQIVSETLTNDVYKKETLAIYHNVLKGNALSESLQRSEYWPAILSKMSKVGEESGNMSEVLEYLAGFYELEVDTATKNLSTMLEPALLIFIGLVVGFIAMSIINPIYDLTSKVGG